MKKTNSKLIVRLKFFLVQSTFRGTLGKVQKIPEIFLHFFMVFLDFLKKCDWRKVTVNVLRSRAEEHFGYEFL